MRDYADKEWLHEMAPAALPVLVALIAFGALLGAAAADWWITGGELIAGAVNCVVVR